jgi:deazaflavin-dependent oxidoreductase (nitroreductase family)
MAKKHAAIRKFNRAIYNRLAKSIAWKWMYALVTHIGRKSGKAYTTPVVANYRDGYIYIPLPYGKDTDWFLNILAAKECVVKINGKSFKSAEPQVIDIKAALPAFSSFHQAAFKAFQIHDYLRLKAN